MKTQLNCAKEASAHSIGHPKNWIWHFNRGWTDKRSIWHNYKGKSLVVMLFGDGRVQACKFPTIPEGNPYWDARPNPANEWW